MTTASPALRKIGDNYTLYLPLNSPRDERRPWLPGIDLSSYYLQGLNLLRGNLNWANLSGAVLSQADLMEAMLRQATLLNAWLSGADLTGATVTLSN